MHFTKEFRLLFLQMAEHGASICLPNRAATKTGAFTSLISMNARQRKRQKFCAAIWNIQGLHLAMRSKLLVKNIEVETAARKQRPLFPKHGENWLKKVTKI